MGNPLQSKLDLTLGRLKIGSTPKEFARQLQIQFRQTLLHRKGYPSHRPLSWSPLLIFSFSRSIFRFLTSRRARMSPEERLTCRNLVFPRKLERKNICGTRNTKPISMNNSILHGLLSFSLLSALYFLSQAKTNQIWERKLLNATLLLIYDTTRLAFLPFSTLSICFIFNSIKYTLK